VLKGDVESVFALLWHFTAENMVIVAGWNGAQSPQDGTNSGRGTGAVRLLPGDGMEIASRRGLESGAASKSAHYTREVQRG